MSRDSLPEQGACPEGCPAPRRDRTDFGDRELLLSELLGHERGAFTGAIVRRPGLLAVADGGTVFIDEVGDLPLDAQVMVLRLLQSGEIRPVGSIQTRRVDVRLIAATPRDLETAIERGTFRDDPDYRLRHVVIDVPPLRERREACPGRVLHRGLNECYGFGVRGGTRETVRRLG